MIETPRLVLREIVPADAAFIFALMNEPAYHRHIGDRGIRSAEDARTYILDKLAASYGKFGYGLYVVEKKEHQVPTGICGFVKRDTLEHPDIGFAFLSEHRSQGFAFEAATAVLSHGFGPLGLRVVLGVTSPANTASIRLLEKLGLRYQKTMRIPPNENDSLLYSTPGDPTAAKSGR